MNRQQWFLDRVGTRIFRAKQIDDCGCKWCRKSMKIGFLIQDKRHAINLSDMEADICDQRGLDFLYFDTKQEVK